ncbi:MAG: hypothetical protein PHY48_17190 [Candidatus Cloacimonetes bacterium]|nr:hypothetical protein [Candidatus Cloacimonadota bacterium]
MAIFILLISVLEELNVELSYFEYWLTKDTWSCSIAVSFIVNHHMFQRSWEQHEVFNDIRASFKSKLVNTIGSEDAIHLFRKRSVEPDRDADFDYFISGMLNVDDSDIKPKEFLEWLNSKGYEMPYEFKVFIGIEEKEKQMTEREQNNIAKKVCQGVAKTLWHAKPDMTIMDIREHHAIQNFGDGKLFDSDTTLHRWLSEVDPRKKKTGPKRPVL